MDDSFLKSLVPPRCAGRSSSVISNPFFSPFLRYQSLRFEATMIVDPNQPRTSYWTFQTIRLFNPRNLSFIFFSPLFFFSNTFLTNFFHYTRDSSKTRVSYIISPRSSLSLLISASHVSDNLTVKKKKKKKNSYQFLRWPFAIGCARTAGE